jgi:deoxyhypusine synthase
MREKFLHTPTSPLTIEPGMTTDQLLAGMEKMSFQGRQLARAARVWEAGLRSGAFVMMGLAGAMVPAGMRNILTFLMEGKYINCLVSTGANLFHDLYETLGKYHYVGSPQADDEALLEHGIDRIYDTYADELEFEKLDTWIGAWAARALEDRAYTTREFLRELGKEAAAVSGGKTPGILTTAARHDVPIYCPAIGDSSIGIGLAAGARKVLFDVVADVRETAELVAGRETLVIYCGGGTPKNFIQQTEVTVKHIDEKTPGHKYAVQFITDAPHWGGLSGCTFEEAVSWGKINPLGEKVTVFCDATIALPVVVSALATRMAARPR